MVMVKFCCGRVSPHRLPPYSAAAARRYIKQGMVKLQLRLIIGEEAALK